MDFTQPELLVVLDKIRKEEDTVKKPVETQAKIVPEPDKQNATLPVTEQNPPSGTEPQKPAPQLDTFTNERRRPEFECGDHEGFLAEMIIQSGNSSPSLSIGFLYFS